MAMPTLLSRPCTAAWGAAAAMALLLAPTAALACRCVSRTPAQAARAADMVVLAKVERTSVDQPHYDTFQLRVSRSWKGKSAERLAIRSRQTDCLANLEAGRDYLIYLTRRDGALETSNCAGNLPAERAAAAVAALDGRG